MIAYLPFRIVIGLELFLFKFHKNHIEKICKNSFFTPLFQCFFKTYLETGTPSSFGRKQAQTQFSKVDWLYVSFLRTGDIQSYTQLVAKRFQLFINLATIPDPQCFDRYEKVLKIYRMS